MANDHDTKLRWCAEEIANYLIGLPGTQEIDEIAMTLRKRGAFPPPPEIAGRMSDGNFMVYEDESKLFRTF